jgi:hypothetical protein
MQKGREFGANMRVRRLAARAVRIAKPLLKFAPGAAAVLRVPHARADTATVATHALELAKALAPYAELLTSAGYSADFFAEFTREAEALATVNARAEEARHCRSRATAAIRQELKEAMGLVTVIEGIVMAHVGADDRVAMDLWRGMRRVPARAGRPRERGKRRAELHLA